MAPISSVNIELIALNALYLVIGYPTAILCGFIFAVFVLDKHLHKPQFILVALLSFADTILCLATASNGALRIASALNVTIPSSYVFTYLQCVAVSFPVIFSGFMVEIVTFAIAVDRFIAVFSPVTYRFHTRLIRSIEVASIGLLLGVISFSAFIGPSASALVASCSLTTGVTAIYAVFYTSFELTLCVLAIALYLVAYSIEHFRNTKVDTTGARRASEAVVRRTQRERKMAKLIAVLIVVYALTTLPANIFRYVRMGLSDAYAVNALTNGSGYFFMLNAFANAFVYTKKNDEIDARVRAQFRRIFLCRSTNAVAGAGSQAGSTGRVVTVL